MSETFMAYISRYALSGGILIKEVEQRGDGMVSSVLNSTEFYHEKDWHLSFDAAKSQAEKMRLKKIASLRKQISKLENMTFEERS